VTGACWYVVLTQLLAGSSESDWCLLVRCVDTATSR